jgi:nucleotide-binding universal stress UspA family protein
MATTQPDHSARTRHAIPAERPLKVLAVIDGSERTGRIIAYAIDLAQRRTGVEVVLQGIVREAPDGRLRGYGSFKREEIHARLRDLVGQRSVAAAARRLDQERIAHKDRVDIGDPVAVILRTVAEEGADMVLIGDAPAGAVQRWLAKAIGLSVATVASQVALLAPVPVVVVK